MALGNTGTILRVPVSATGHKREPDPVAWWLHGDLDGDRARRPRRP